MIDVAYDPLKLFLKKLGLEVHEQPVTDQTPYKQLTFPVEEDHKKRPIYMSIVTHPVRMGDVGKILNIKSEPKNYFRIQLLSPMPFQFKKENAPELARLLLMINKSLEYPGFEFSEIDRIIYFKMAWPLHEGQIDEALLATQIYYIAGVMSSFSEAIEAIGEGSLSIYQYLGKFMGPSQNEA